MQLTDIPKDVIGVVGLLKYLHWNDLLRFRRVCRWTKSITDAYLQVDATAKRAPEIEINEGTEKTFEAFMAMGIKTTKLFLNNQSGYSFYEKIEGQTKRQFLEIHGPLIKHLRVTQLTMRSFGKEVAFINGLKNLTSFEATYFGNRTTNFQDNLSPAAVALYNRAVDQKRKRIRDRFLPQNFKSLESIKIGQHNNYAKKVDIVTRSVDIFLASPQLKYACHPFDSTFGTGREQGCLVHAALPRALSSLCFYIKKRPNKYYPPIYGMEQLEFYDFENFHHENVPWTVETDGDSYDQLKVFWMGSKLFLDVCSRALETGLKLLNVNASWYCGRYDVSGRSCFPSPALGIPVVSLVGIDPCVMELDMPNLEKIKIPLTSGCVPGVGTRPEWPALKCLDITVDGKVGLMWDVDGKARLADIERVVGRPTFVLFKFLFGNRMVRANMSELSIQFVEGKGKQEVAVPKVEDIVASCPNLKRIKLGNWMGTNKQLVELWKGLPGLEEISLENCKELGNVAFVGEDVEFPVFLSLENLKKLSLKGLDKMPKITDTLFCLVLSKMKLNELVLTSDEPLEKVTKKGITALLEGPFAETIGRFPFRDWSLANMTAEEFKEMEKKFRSYDMI